MPPRKQKTVPPTTLPDNALAKQAIDAIRAIDREAQEKRLQQLEQLKAAKASIIERVNELHHQLAQIDKAMEAITGQPAVREKSERRNLKEVRERVERWMDGHKGEKYGAGDLAKEFPELEGVSISLFLKPLVESGKIHTDASAGLRRTKYFIPEA
jgi:hypothetical protein